MKESILESYDLNLNKYKEYTQHLHYLISSLLSSHSIPVHGIYARVKERYSLEEKVKVKEKYQNIDEITDIIGVRVITYFEDTIEDIKELIGEEFLVDEANSVDKRIRENPTEFGYSSLHLVLKLNEKRADLKEYSKYKNIKFEVQIRSLLQHAWAEIEHDIGYKNNKGLPKEVKRSFSRVASLLELADMEFGKIKETTLELKKSIAQVPNLKESGLLINKLTLEEFIKREEIVNRMDSHIAEETGSGPLRDLLEHRVEHDSERLNDLGINNLKDFYDFLNSKEKEIIEFGRITREGMGEEHRNFQVYEGYSVFIAIYILMMEKLDEDEIEAHLRKYKFSPGAFERLKERYEKLINK